MGYKNEFYRAEPPMTSTGSVCIPAILKDWSGRGWPGLGLEQAEKSITKANPRDASIDGLSYSFHICQEPGGEKINLRIASWRYDKSGETTDLPLLEIIFDSRRFASPVKAIESIKVMARPLALTEKVGSRALNAALFFINQIKADQIPDFERVLELHRLYRKLPEAQAGARDQNNRGMPRR